ncbi:MAG: sigma 54-interacting transcriptional regulator [Candidatus Brocadiia bacterium]
MIDARFVRCALDSSIVQPSFRPSYNDMPDKIKLLVVEDTDADFRLVVEYLKESRLSSFETTRAKTLSEALQAISANKFQAALTDLGLPDSQGLTIVDNISKADPDIAIIVLTGLDDDKLGLDALNKRAQDYIAKGRLQAEILDKSIRYAIERKRTEDQLRKSELKFRAIFDSAPCGIMILDEERRVHSVNRVIENAFNISSAKVHNKRGGEALNCIHSFETPEGCGFSQACKECIIRKNAVYSLQNKESYRSKTTLSLLNEGVVQDRTVLISSAPIEYDGKQRAVIILEDITEMNELRRRLKAEHSFAGIIGKDPKMLDLYDAVRELAESNASVMLQGESGTGKELVALALHNEGLRSDRQFVAVNCGALPDNLLESELFGHVKGAFTGAVRDKKGRFELADGGTIFLDEIGDLSPAMQVKLLRVLQDGSFEPVGSEKTLKVDVRVICATNKSLKQEIAAGRFREDLFYRLCVIPITLPPLRERLNDIPLIAEYLLERFAQEAKSNKAVLTPEAMSILLDHNWPGNVRELQNALQLAIIKSQNGNIRPEHLPRSIYQPAAGQSAATGTSKSGTGKRRRRCKVESADAIEHALKQAKGNKIKAAEILNISRATLYRCLDRKK